MTSAAACVITIEKYLSDIGEMFRPIQWKQRYHVRADLRWWPWPFPLLALGCQERSVAGCCYLLGRAAVACRGEGLVNHLPHLGLTIDCGGKMRPSMGIIEAIDP